MHRSHAPPGPRHDTGTEARHRNQRPRPEAFMSMKDIIFFNKKIDLKTREQLYLQIPLNIVLLGCDSSALKQSHLDKLTAFHHKCAYGS
jgi:hypothetical protein